MTQNLFSITASIVGSDLPPMRFIVSALSEKDALDAAVQDAIEKGVDPELLDIADFDVMDITPFARDFVEANPAAYEPTLFEKCVTVACGDEDTARDVIQTIIDNTDSPYTIDELTRVLSEEA